MPPVPKRGPNKQRSALRKDGTSNDARPVASHSRRVHFDNKTQRSLPAQPGQIKNGLPSADRDRIRGGSNAGRARTQQHPEQQTKTTTASRFGVPAANRTGRPTISDSMTNQIASHISPSFQAPKRDAVAGGETARFEAMKLSEAITLVGTCEDMCPEYERVKRIVEKDVWYEERDERFEDEGLRANRKADESRMVKRFARSAAGQEEQLPSDLRPPYALTATLDYLLDFVAGRADSLGDVHHFVWDRTRAIRNDFSIQQVSKSSDVRHAITCFEIIARFHIVSLHLLAQPEKPYDEYDPQQEREQLDKTILSLLQLYEDHRDKFQSRNEAEFRAYQIIFQIQQPSPNLEDRIQCWNAHIVNDPQVQHALRIYRAACNSSESQGPLRPGKPHRIAQSHWMSFWDAMRSPETSYLMACVAEIYFPLVRRNALRAVWKVYKTKLKQDGSDWTPEELQEVLGMDDLTEVTSYLMKFGFQLKRGDDGSQRVNFSSTFGNLTEPHGGQTCTSLVENKRRGFRIPAIAKNMDAEEAQEKGFIDYDEDEGAEEGDEDEEVQGKEGDGDEDSLFVPENVPSAKKPPNPFATALNSQGPSQNSFGTSITGGSLFQGKSSGSVSMFTPASAPLNPSQSSLFTPKLGTGDAPFKDEFQRQQLFGMNSQQTAPFLQSVATEANQRGHQDSISADQKEREARESAARAQEEANRAAEARVAEEQLQRAAALEAERAAKARAAKEMAERRRQIEAQKAEEESRRIEMERQRAVAAQEAERRQLESAKAQVFEDLARRMLLEPDGFLDQFVEYKAGPMIHTLGERLEEERLQNEACSFRTAKLRMRYGAKWREICRKRSLARVGRERRARRRQGQQERERRAQEAKTAQELDHFRRSQQQLRDSLASSRASSAPSSPRERSSVRLSRSSITRSPAPHIINQSRSNHPQAQAALEDGNTPSNQVAPHDQAMPLSTTLNQPVYTVTGGVLSRSRRSPRDGLSDNRATEIPFDGLSYTEWMAQRRAAKVKPTFRDSTNSTYFRMKAMGLDPRRNSLSPHVSRISKSPPSLKRQRTSDSLNSSFVEQDTAAVRQVMPPPPPRKTARISPPSQDPKLTSFHSSTDSARQAQAPIDEDDDFMRQIQEVANVIQEGEQWYRSEWQAEEHRRSAESSRRSSITSLNNASAQAQKTHWAGHPAENAHRRDLISYQNSTREPNGRSTSGASGELPQAYDPTPPPMAPLKYRSRISQFLPRDQYADARAERGEPMFIGNAQAEEVSASSHNPQPDLSMPLLNRNNTYTQDMSTLDAEAYKAGPLNDTNAVPSAPIKTQQANALETEPASPPKVFTAFSHKNNHDSSFLGLIKNPNANNIFGTTSTFSGFDNAPSTIASAATSNPFNPFTSIDQKTASSSPPPDSVTTPKEIHLPSSSRPSSQQQNQGLKLSIGDSSRPSSQQSHFLSRPPSAPFASESQHQNPYSQVSQYAQHNPFATASAANHLAPQSAKKTPFAFDSSLGNGNDSSERRETQDQDGKAWRKARVSPPPLKKAKSKKTNNNPFQSGRDSFGNVNPFAALEGMDEDGSGDDNAEEVDEPVDGSEQLVQDDGDPAAMPEMEDEESVGFSSESGGGVDANQANDLGAENALFDDESGDAFGSEDEKDSLSGDVEDDADGDEDLEDEEDENKDDGDQLINGKGGTSVEDAIEL
ncbi:MAG: hypothetical protein Q9162_000497 [Coniocarpon cinnabarinum]